MEKRRRTTDVDGEIHLHETIIQHIQSFLNRKQAAQTSLLCKTWYNAWATRPIVDLDQRHFQSRGPLIADEFLEYSKKFMRRYEESNLSIESFRFCMKNMKTDCFSIVKELVVDAMKLGVCDLNVEVGTSKFDLPHEVLRSENLVRLTVGGCRIDLGGKLGFSKLKSLSLRGVYIVGIPSLNIVSYCPLIEELVLSNCTYICTVRIEDIKFNDEVRIRNGDTVEIARMKVQFDAPIQPYNNLKCLYLERIRIDGLLFKNMSTSFPCLKDLTLSHCHCWGFHRLKISSSSLEFLIIANITMQGAKFDVPRLRKFTFSDNTIPSLSFKATSREWESDISITNMEGYISSFGLTKLKNFLIKLSLSKISLYLHFFSFEIRNEKGFALIGHVPSLPIPEVENLMLSMRDQTPVCSSLLKGLFWACRPKIITHGLLPEFSIGWEENICMLSLLRRTLTKKGSNGYCIPRQHLFDKYGLGKVDVEGFIDCLAEWRPLPWEALRDASEIPGNKQKIRFKLGWRQNPSAHLDEIL